jgi:hypothetical protein
MPKKELDQEMKRQKKRAMKPKKKLKKVVVMLGIRPRNN